MALLSKIRDKSGLLIAAVGLAMVSFVISPKDIIDFFTNRNHEVIGTVNGKEIMYKEYAERVEAYKQSNKENQMGPMQVENLIWNQMVSEKIYESKLEEAGIVIGEEEIWNQIVASNEVQASPQFKDQNGVFNEDKLKEYVANIQNAKTAEEKSRLQAWLNYERAVKQQIAVQTYNDLVRSGVYLTNQEAKNDYKIYNTMVSGSYVCLPYSRINNNSINITTDEVEDYVKNHKNQFKTEATRTIKVVSFPFIATYADEQVAKNEVAKLIEDKQEYNTTTKQVEKVFGLRNTVNYQDFVTENGSDDVVNYGFQAVNTIPYNIKQQITGKPVGTVVGPYKNAKFYAVSKIAGIQKMPDSVQASHILISFAGSQSATPNETKSPAQAKKMADSLLTIVQKSPAQFAVLAQKYSSDPGSKVKGGDLGWFTYTQMVPEFRDFVFEKSVGSMGVVETAFGYHIIKVTAQKNFQDAYKLITISKKIETSASTENNIFEKSQKFLQAVNSNNFDAKAKELNYRVAVAENLKSLDAYITSVGENRTIVKWAFDKDTDVNDIKNFELTDGGYAIAMVTNVQEAGIMNATSAMNIVKPRLLKEKKAAILSKKLTGNNLQALASANKVKVENLAEISLIRPMIPQVGVEAGLVSAMVKAKPNKVVSPIVGNNGVYAFVVSKSVKPNNTIKNNQVKAVRNQMKSIVSNKLFEALKAEATIEDYRAERM